MATAAPPFYFQTDHLRPNEDPRYDPYGNWRPPINNTTFGGGTSYCYFKCDGRSILQIPALPPGCVHFKTFSMYYDDSKFYVVNYDASSYPVGGVGRRDLDLIPWKVMHFEHRTNCSSYATIAATDRRLQVERENQRWPRILIPDSHRAHPGARTPYDQYGAMNGELPIVIALNAYSVEPDHVLWLWSRFNYNWHLHDHQTHGRRDHRGMVIRTWYHPGETSQQDLIRYENGQRGSIYP